MSIHDLRPASLRERVARILALTLVAVCAAQPADARSVGRIDNSPAGAAGAYVAGLKDYRTRHTSVQQLHTLPAADVVRALVPAIRWGFDGETDALEVAYGLLAARAADPEHSQRLGALSAGEPTALFVEGTKNASRSVRHTCARALGGALPTEHERAIPALLRLLDTDDWPVVAQAAQSLGELGPAAATALDPLLARMRDPEPAVRDSMTAFAAAEVAAGRPEPKDLELKLRASCAVARVQIGGAGIDLERYPKLDAIGRAATADALCAVIVWRLAAVDPGARSSSAPKPIASARESEIALNQLGAVLEGASWALRDDLVRVAAMAAYDPDASVRTASDRAIAAAERSTIAATRELARRLRAEVAKRPR